MRAEPRLRKWHKISFDKWFSGDLNGNPPVFQGMGEWFFIARKKQQPAILLSICSFRKYSRRVLRLIDGFYWRE